MSGLSMGVTPGTFCMMSSATARGSLPGCTLTSAAEMLLAGISSGRSARVLEIRATSWAVSKVKNMVWSRPVPVGVRLPFSVIK